MDNHTHLIIYDNGNDISKLITSINISYAYYFNNTYKRSGHLFQDRFKAIVEYTNYVLEPEEDLKILEVDEDLIIAKKENHNYIDTIEQAREKITSIGQESKQTFEDMINNKETRDELIKMLRNNSSLTLKEIGKLFGGLSESRVSRIAKE